MLINSQFPVYEVTRDGYLLSTDPARFDLEAIHRYLSLESYWAKGITKTAVSRSMHFAFCFGVYHASSQVGFARVITDFAKHGYIADVYILPTHQGQGLGKWLIKTILEHPELIQLPWWHLHTKDAHGLYAQFGFGPYPDTRKYMAYSTAKK